MTYTGRFIFSVLMLMSFVEGSLLAAKTPETNYGLYFKAEKCISAERTKLQLNDGEPIAFDSNLTLDFKMMARKHSTPIGAIAHFTLDNGQAVRFIYASDEQDKIRPTLVYNNVLTYLPTENLHQGEWINISLGISADKNKVRVRYADLDTTIVVPINNAKSAEITMGRLENYNSDVVPMNIREVRVSTDGKEKYFWKLGKHNDDVCFDSENNNVARAYNPKWLIDNHREWNLIYTDSIGGTVDTAFDPISAKFYLIRQNGIDVIDEDGVKVESWDLAENYHTANAGHAVFDSNSKDLVLYSLSSLSVNRYSTTGQKWIVNEDVTTDPLHYNHARAYNPVDSCYYFFGGYGHYAYRNDLFRLSAKTGKIEKVNYSNPIPPRFGATMAAKNNKLYISGGRGNEAGKQALDTYFYYDLWEIDLKTLKARKLWNRSASDDGRGWMMASSMYTLPDDERLYALNMDANGGTLMQFSVNDSTYSEVSGPINNTLAYQNFAFSLYYSESVHKFFMIIHKISIDKQHTISVYTLNTPLLNETELNQVSEKKPISAWIWISIAVVLIIGCILFIIIRTRKSDRKSKIVKQSAKEKSSSIARVADEASPAEEESSFAEDMDTLMAEDSVKKYYDTSKSSIILVGGFGVRDKDGNDITMSFTPKLKEFLLLMILSSGKADRGITVSKVTEAIWYNKEGSSARNTRNVTVRKLRMLLESIGDVELSNQGGFMKLSIPDNVYCDYAELQRCADSLEHHSFSEVELHERVLEILLGGALLPNSSYPWLDEYKSSYSSLSIDLLTNLLHKSQESNNDKMVLRIVRVMFVHDPLSEEALSAYCRTLVSQGKRGIAKKVYDKFCRDFQSMMGEPYSLSFNDVLNSRKE